MPGRETERQRMRRAIARAGVAMLVTTDGRGDQAGRPMLPLLIDNDPHVYFLTHESSRKVTHIAARPQVGLMIITGPSFLSIVGRAEACRDAGLIARLWRPTYRAWFPAGRDDREATVLRVAVERIDYWEPPRSRFVRVFEALKAIVTGHAVETPMKTVDGL